MMATQIQPRKSTGELMAKRYNLSHCSNCDAAYSPSKHWVYGWYSEGTDNKFNIMGRRKETECPLCGQKNTPNDRIQ